MTSLTILQFCSDWTTVDQVQAGLGYPPTCRAHNTIRALLNNRVRTGRMEKRRVEGRPPEYRTLPDRPPEATLQVRVLAVLEGTMDTLQIAEAVGCTSDSARHALKILESKGAVRRLRTRPVALWEAARCPWCTTCRTRLSRTVRP